MKPERDLNQTDAVEIQISETGSDSHDSHHDEDARTVRAAYMLAAAAVLGLIGATIAFGVPGLAMAMLCVVPVMFITLVRIAWG